MTDKQMQERRWIPVTERLRRMIMAKCTGRRCPMQVGYKVEECNHKDCPYRTEPITNAQKIRSMSDEELIGFLVQFQEETINRFARFEFPNYSATADWLQQPAE